MLLVLAFHSISKHERGLDPFCREKKTFTRGRRFVSLRGHQDAEIMLDYFRIRKKNREKKAQRNLNLGPACQIKTVHLSHAFHLPQQD